MREVIVTGKTVEEATEKACLELGLPREEVSIEILEMPTRKLFKTTPAKVKATADEAEAPAVEEKPAPQPVKAEAKKEAPKTPEKKPKTPEKKPKAPEKKPEAPKAEPAPVKEEVPAEEAAQDAPITEAQQAQLDAAVAYLKTVFAAMGAGEVTVTTSKQGEACIIRVEGDDVGMLIGHRGETMESLSYLASLVANRLPGEYIKLGLDVAGYRGKREKDLEALARRMGAKVARTGRSWAMDPMNPYERRIIHSTISGMEGVRSESKGEGADRRVVIY
ncbi:RNA-binding cell elongation regulator Jag/EloR, partial [Candidatus Allofournierella excrementavium]|uniref:RNA-binding cell elongation regulator Jag/EloR n=1 Tax=Candidatus Allofournierella excrementavium TaxID=2838591 RepID=UPI003A838F39